MSAAAQVRAQELASLKATASAKQNEIEAAKLRADAESVARWGDLYCVGASTNNPTDDWNRSINPHVSTSISRGQDVILAVSTQTEMNVRN